MPLTILGSLALALAALAFPLWLAKRSGSFERGRRGSLALVLAASLAFGVLVHFLARAAEARLVDGPGQSATQKSVLLLLLVAPLSEGLKAVAVWPLYQRRKLVRGALGATYAAVAAGGFAATHLALRILAGGGTGLELLRALVALPAHYFFAGLWGHMLGGLRRDRHFGWVFLASVAMHGVYEHLIFARGPAYLVVAFPMLAMMTFGVLGLLREPSPSSRPSSLSLFEPSAAESVRAVMARGGRPVAFGWIVFGALVTLGVMLTLLGLAIYFGHRFGVDFAAIENAGTEGMVPLGLLGAALLLAFPVSAFLVARASGAASVLEPAWATIVAIVSSVVLFSLTETSALLVVLAVAPVGFALACAGAWFGLSRRA